MWDAGQEVISNEKTHENKVINNPCYLKFWWDMVGVL
jgi:hypothetical protein